MTDETRSPAIPFLRPLSTPLGGVALKEAELLTRRLLESEIPEYKVLPIPPEEQVALHSFLCSHGFDSLHPALDPGSRGSITEQNRPYGVPIKRAERKRQQIANVIGAVGALAPSIRRKGRGPNSPRTYADFCGGCGHVGLVLAALYPSWIVHIVDAKPAALAIAKKRAKEAGVQNVRLFEGDLMDFDNAFDIGVALHACGGASDAVIAKCVSKGAALVISPCCVGGVVSEKGSVTGFGSGARIKDFANEGQFIDFSLPRSQRMRNRLTSPEFISMAQAADYGESGANDPWRRVAKAMIEIDRCTWLKEANYESVLSKMKPESCTPKNDLIIAFPAGSVKVKWDADSATNTGILTVLKGSSLDGFPVSRVAAVERRLRSMVLADDGPGKAEFACARGARERKLVHAVAESLSLHHESVGRGSRRRVRVSRNRFWPLYCDYYIGVAGEEVQRVGELLMHLVPPAARAARETARGSMVHVTVISPSETRQLLEDERFGDKAELMWFVKERLEGTFFTSQGVGMYVQGDCMAYYVVLDWEAAVKCRNELDLPYRDLHITLGFIGSDVHSVDKGASTLIAEEVHKCSPWGSTLTTRAK